MKWIIWKEWRENRLVPLWIALLTPLAVVAFRLAGVIEHRPDAEPFLMMAWLLAAIFAGSGLIAREVGGETLQFITAHPVSRRQIWWIKLGMGAVVLLTSCALSTVTWLGARALMLGGSYAGNTAAEGPSNVGFWALVLCGAAACFALSLAASTLMDRTVSAAMAAVVGGFVLFIAIIVISSFRTVFVGRGMDESAAVGVMPVLLIPGLLASSFWAFTRGESMRTRKRFLWASLGGLAGLAATWIPATAGLAWHTRFNPHNIWVRDTIVSPTGNLVAVRDNRYSADENKNNHFHLVRPDHLVLEDTRTGTRQILPGGDIVAWSPDDRFLIWRPDVTPFLGMAVGWQGLGDVCLDTQTNRQSRLNEEAEWQGTFSPDGHWFAQDNIQYPGPAARIYRSEALMSEYFYRSEFLTSEYPRACISLPSPNEPSGSVTFGGDDPRQAVHLAWSCNSHYLYGAWKIDALASPSFDAASIGPAPSDPNITAATLALCTVPVGYRLELEMTANPHRVLAGLTEPNDLLTVVIDLDAATRDAERKKALAAKHRSPALPAAVDTWLAHYAVARVPCTSRSASVISPDGRVVLSRPGKQSSVLKVFDLDHPEIAPKTLTDVTLPDKGDWEPGSHRFLTRTPGCGDPRIVDPVAGTVRLIPDPRKNGLWQWHAVAIASVGEIITSSAPNEHEFPTFSRVEMPAR